MRVNSAVKFSYNITKGSIADRQKLVSKLNEEFFYSFQDLFLKGSPKLKEIKDVYKKILPERKRIKVLSLKNSEDTDGASNYIYGLFGGLKGQTIEIPTTKNSRVSVDNFVAIMHENTHILNVLMNPRNTALAQKLYLNGMYNKKRNYWFEESLYIDEDIKKDSDIERILKLVKDETELFLKSQSTIKKIMYLQDARYQLEEEQLAYSEQYKYALKLNNLGYKIDKNDLIDCEKVFLFKEKINLLKEMTADLIKKERENIHKTNLKNKA